jgi:dTDP-4-amino-4,6-dideoxygalactose transaminase
MPVSESVAARILCLPLYADMPVGDLQHIVDTINQQLP